MAEAQCLQAELSREADLFLAEEPCKEAERSSVVDQSQPAEQ
jgi:hypothetical protein